MVEKCLYMPVTRKVSVYAPEYEVVYVSCSVGEYMYTTLGRRMFVHHHHHHPSRRKSMFTTG